jgi:diguanylate cyclase (GGDEF)-like protein
MQSSLLVTIVIMGLLSVGFTLFTGEVFLQKTLDNRRQIFTKLVELEVHNRWSKLKEDTRSLGLSIQSSKGFKVAYQRKDIVAVEKQLDEHFSRAFVTLGVLDLKKIIVYDAQLKKVFQSSKGDDVAKGVCAELIIRAKRRVGSDRFKTLHQVCDSNGQLRLVSLVPVGGLRLKGYMSVVVDPVIGLIKSEDGLGIPLMIKNTEGKELYKSENWPEKDMMKNIMLIHYVNRAGNKNPVANFYFSSDVTLLKENLSKTRVNLISFVVISTFIAMIIALALFRRTILDPLYKISFFMKKIRKDRKYLKEILDVSGSSELVDLASEMSGLSCELSELYSELEEMAFTDSLTGIPNRALLFDRLNQMMLFANRDKSHSEFMLMMMDLNKFKTVNDELGHHIGDELLVSVADRLKQALRQSDTVARIGGDEFAIILYAVNERSVAEAVAEKITLLMREDFIIEGHDIDVGMSIGISRFPFDGRTSGELMQSADMAMYHSKRNKIPYVFYNKELSKGS